ncbi:hypothetical protein OBBRIDRAFT_15633 [Obba rivulosa]|uniref:Anti-proliferative protein domain-containing protein n=1 Tax=Obba rivulosa TaxID=1052685 RepID=A0A8E2J7B3_9APHY|nr:hypothetical protein OBBRIDRAFT_15633 [Obba rivulosa]
MATFTATMPGDLSVTLDHAIMFLTQWLVGHYSASTIHNLELALKTNLTDKFVSSWVPCKPRSGFGRRFLTLSRTRIPPRAIDDACKSLNVDWNQWFTTIGGPDFNVPEFDLLINPGCVSVRCGNQCSPVWEEIEAQSAKAAPAPARPSIAPRQRKTFAQQLIEDDEDVDELFAMLSNVISQFPSVPVTPRSCSSSPVSVKSTLSHHSRSSSSSSSSGLSFSSCGSSDSYGSVTTVSQSSCSVSPADEKPMSRMSRRERARQSRVYIDTSKKEVTNYDGGKTTVLTGGVMLGGAVRTPKCKPAVHKKTNSSSLNWRSPRA